MRIVCVEYDKVQEIEIAENEDSMVHGWYRTFLKISTSSEYYKFLDRFVSYISSLSKSSKIVLYARSNYSKITRERSGSKGDLSPSSSLTGLTPDMTKPELEIVSSLGDVTDYFQLSYSNFFFRSYHIETTLLSPEFLSIPLIVEGNDNKVGLLNIMTEDGSDQISLFQKVYPMIKCLSDILLFGRYHMEEKFSSNEFIASMSHEIRTPLNCIIGVHKMLEETKLDDQQLEYLNILNTSSLQLLDLLNDILDYFRMRFNKISLRKEPFIMEKTVASVVEMLSAEVSRKDLKLVLESDIPKDIIVHGDEKRLKQILINLINNAIKFTDKGSITVKLKATYPKADIINITFQIEDTGSGISPHMQSHLFEPFFKGKNSKSGVGLGLTISKELVTLMGGILKYKTNYDTKKSGTIFTFSLEFELDLPLITQTENILKLKGMDVIAVDDTVSERFILINLLTKLGLNATVCSTPDEVLLHFKLGKKFKAAIIDIYMPEMSGVELAQYMRETYPDTFLIALSGSQFETGKEWFDVYLTKPIEKTKLIQALLQSLSKRKSQSFSYYLKEKHLINVLVVEDDPNNIFIIRKMIKGLGYHNIKCVTTGEYAIKQVQKKDYDIIFMDIKLPGIDGVETTSKIREILKEKTPTVVAVSANVFDFDKERCKEVKMEGYITKPIKKEDLETILNQIRRKIKY